ncbi:MAG: hypothetical protein ABIP55_09240 [Tepidisphaeraceae bacterium]
MRNRLIFGALCVIALTVTAPAAAPAQVKLRVEDVHPWRPPFGIARVGQGRAAVVEVAGDEPLPELTLSAWRAGKEVGRQAVRVSDKPPRLARVAFDGVFDMDELVLAAAPAPSAAAGATANAALAEFARLKVELPPFEAGATAAPEKIINPVDLGAILVPGDWLLLGPGQAGRVTVRAIQRGEAKKNVAIKAWFESAPDKQMATVLPLTAGHRGEATINLPAAIAEKDVLHVAAFDADGKELWKKAIPTMRVNKPLDLPRFGAVETRLRYDAPISVRDPATGKFSSLPYADGWGSHLKDIVVALPNGSRFVFWRGSSYIPFWLSRHNVGLCCEWAEIITPFPPDATDCVEPLMDKELRYGRVEVIESTAARVHVRWTYQSNDLLYKVWGDQAVEDYYFYPDGFGTRVLTLKRDPARTYELSEFILIAPQETYPLSFVPQQPIDILFTDGEKRRVSFPATESSLGGSRDMPAVYRARMHKDEPASVVYFTPRLRTLPRVFGPFHDQGQLVTPAYWGSHWPLARGNATGSAIDERIHATPHHTSLASWQGDKPEPISTRTGPSIDALGQSKIMTTEQWVWMIGMTDAPDAEVMVQAQSFAAPPPVEATGARIHADGYVPERRAVRLIADGVAGVMLKLTPNGSCAHPVFELDKAPPKLKTVTLDGRALDAGQYAWDGRVLWLRLTFDKPVQIGLEFEAR